MDGSAAYLLAGGYFAAMAAWLGGIVESIGIWRFWPWVYRFGIPVNVQPPPGAGPSPLGLPAASERVVATVTADGAVLFRAPMGLFNVGRLRSLSPIKGTLAAAPEGTRVVGRLPVMPLVFVGLWLTLWTGLNVRQALAGQWAAVLVVVFGWAVAAAVCGFWVVLERWQFRGAVDAILKGAS